MCLLSKPAVDGLEREIGERARLFRVDRETSLAQELARRHGLRLLPGLLIFDGQGRLAAVQQGWIDRRAAADLVRQLAGDGAISCPAEPSPSPACNAP